MNHGAGGSWCIRQYPDGASSSSSPRPPNIYSPDDLPKTVVRKFHLGSEVKSMDFHPHQHAVLAVGTNVGDISLWKVGSKEMLLQRTFKVWNISVLSGRFQLIRAQDATISVNRCVWDPDGTKLGVAFSQHIVQIYKYDPTGVLTQHLEIDAHIGGVNDIAFAIPNGQHCIITCGDDKTVKVWDIVALRMLYTFEGHEGPVYSVCPHSRNNIQFVFSTSIDGKIKGWFYNWLELRVEFDVPGHYCTSLAYSDDGTRLFSCGISKEFSHLVEWNDRKGFIKRTYSGLRRQPPSAVQFDTRNRFLVAGDDHLIKFWDMDNTNMLAHTYAERELPTCPRLRFNKEGSLLAISTRDKGFKILANYHGLGILTLLEHRVPHRTCHLWEPIDARLTL